MALVYTNKYEEMCKMCLELVLYGVQMFKKPYCDDKKKDNRILKSIEMSLWLKILKTNWTESATNEELLERIDEIRSILNTIIRKVK